MPDPPPKPAPTAAELVRKWAARIDTMDYFQILRVERPKAVGQWPDDGELRRAFATFAASFHPDRYKNEAPDIQELATTIFRRGNEALRVLLNPGLRARYIRHLARGKMRLEGEEMTRSPTIQMAATKEPIVVNTGNAIAAPRSSSSSSSMKAAGASIESMVKHPAALQFAKEADILLGKNELKKALFALQMVLSKEPDNAGIQQWIAAISDQLKKPAPPR